MALPVDDHRRPDMGAPARRPGASRERPRTRRPQHAKSSQRSDFLTMADSLRLLAVPTLYADPIDSGDELHDTTALVQARAWRSEGAPLLVLAGDVGTGKSLAAAAVLAEHRASLGRANPWGRLELPAWH